LAHHHLRIRANGIDTTKIVANGVTNAMNVYNEFHQVTTNYNALNEVTTYTYDSSRRLSTVTRPNGLVTTYTYDGTSGFLSTVVDSDGVTNLRTNSYTYTNGLVLSHIDERNLSTTNTWDALGRLTKTANRDGAINHTYDKLDLVKTLDRMGFTNGYAYNGFREPLRHTNANKAVTIYAYCDCGSLESVTDPLGNPTSYTYDNLGRRTRTTYPGGSYVDSTYDLFGNATRTADNLGVSVTNYYTIHGLPYTASNTFGRVFLRSYDNNDRVIGSIDPNGASLAFRMTTSDACWCELTVRLTMVARMICTFGSTATITPTTCLARWACFEITFMRRCFLHTDLPSVMAPD